MGIYRTEQEKNNITAEQKARNKASEARLKYRRIKEMNEQNEKNDIVSIYVAMYGTPDGLAEAKKELKKAEKEFYDSTKKV